MIRFEVDTTHPTTKQPQQLPASVSSLMGRANEYLRDRLAPLENEPIAVVWNRFENHGSDGWSADVRLDSSGWSVGQRFYVNRVEDQLELNRSLRELVLDFTGHISERTRADLLRLVNDLRDFRQQGGE